MNDIFKYKYIISYKHDNGKMFVYEKNPNNTYKLVSFPPSRTLERYTSFYQQISPINMRCWIKASTETWIGVDDINDAWLELL